VKVLLVDFLGLLNNVIAYVKGERLNLSTLTLILSNVITCFLFQLSNPFVGSYFDRAMSKICQYAYDDFNLCARFLITSLKHFQASS
jgi:hypothetical protein